MNILLWLLPAATVTGTAMIVVAWVGRARPEREMSEADQERFAAAILRPMPTAGPDRARPLARTRERSTGVAVRRSDQPGPTRRSA
ncbi:MAG: hypothetical protein JWR52_2564 [Marmoricola sp.]|nr:hypothetical protein [Marmoricola sp.]